jgi:hypothetical protein
MIAFRLAQNLDSIPETEWPHVGSCFRGDLGGVMNTSPLARRNFMSQRASQSVEPSTPLSTKLCDPPVTWHRDELSKLMSLRTSCPKTLFSRRQSLSSDPESVPVIVIGGQQSSGTGDRFQEPQTKSRLIAKTILVS